MNEPESKELINPPTKPYISNHIDKLNEKIYASSTFKPLGRRSYFPDIPSSIQSDKFTFGKETEKGDKVAELMCPPCHAVHEYIPFGGLSEHLEAFKLERKDPSEPTSTAGIKSNADPSGRLVREAMTWYEPKRLNLIPLRARRIKKRNKHAQALGFISHQKKEIGPEDSEFDEPDIGEYVNPAVVHRKKGKISKLRSKLKFANYHNFDDVVSAFQEYNVGSSGKISAQELQVMCGRFGFPVTISQAEEILAECDNLDKDGYISYKEFLKNLNWEGRLPEIVTEPFPKVDDKHRWQLRPKEETPEIYKTSNSLIGETLQVEDKTKRICGILTKRADLKVPKLRLLHDFTDYGDMADISCLLKPTVFTEHGVWELDLFALRKKDEMKTLFSNAKIEISDSLFENLWQEACNRCKNEFICIEDFCKILDEYTYFKYKENVVDYDII